jgi:hypothetical protein
MKISLSFEKNNENYEKIKIQFNDINFFFDLNAQFLRVNENKIICVVLSLFTKDVRIPS